MSRFWKSTLSAILPSERILNCRRPPEFSKTAASHLNQKIIPGKTLLILEEIQECPEARTAVKFLAELGTVDIVETWSLREVNKHAVRSYPVGFEEILPMFPMDFEEFLWACQTRPETLDHLKACYDSRQPVEPSLHQKFLDLFYRYLIVGGMPEAVQDYVLQQNISAVNQIQQNILNLYRLDVLKYAAEQEKTRISMILDSIPDQLSSKSRRFFLSKLRKSARMERYENSLLWLEEAGVALPCYNCSEIRPPLKLNRKRSLFRLYLNDTGLLTSSFGAEAQYQILQGNLEVNFGAVLENAFAQALRSKEFPLYYYDNKRMELDFLIQTGSEIQVLEIKSGKEYKSHPSLSAVMKDPACQIGQAVVFCKGNVEEDNGILYLPLYMIMFFETKQEENFVLSSDADLLFGL